MYSSEFLPGNDNPIYQGAILEEGPIVSWIPDLRDINDVDTLYNFELEVGDTVAFFEAMSPFYFYIGEIDSIRLDDNILRKRIQVYVDFVNTPEIETTLVNIWVEGIGDLQYGLIYPFCVSTNPRCADELICFRESEIIVYESFLLACSITTSLRSYSKDSFFKIYPNPFLKSINLELSLNKEFLILIHDISGRLLKREKINNFSFTNDVILDLNELERGVYYITLISKEIKISKPIIKH